MCHTSLQTPLFVFSWASGFTWDSQGIEEDLETAPPREYVYASITCSSKFRTDSFLTGYGMPSDHAMFLFFATTYLVSYLSELPRLKRSSWLLSTFSTVFLSLSVCYSRLYLGVHSEQQVLVGMSLGLVFGRVWFVLCRNYLLHWRSMGSFVHGCIDACEGLFLGKSKEV